MRRMCGWLETQVSKCNYKSVHPAPGLGEMPGVRFILGELENADEMGLGQIDELLGGAHAVRGWRAMDHADSARGVFGPPSLRRVSAGDRNRAQYTELAAARPGPRWNPRSRSQRRRQWTYRVPAHEKRLRPLSHTGRDDALGRHLAERRIRAADDLNSSQLRREDVRRHGLFAMR